MEVTFTIDGLNSVAKATEKVRQSVANEINIAVFAGAQQIVTEAKKSILDGQKSGRTYKRRSVTHRASTPGEAPASDTGRQVNSTHAEAIGNGEALAISGSSSVRYATLLEFGTRFIAPRPFMVPAVEKCRKFITDRLGLAVSRGIEKAGS